MFNNLSRLILTLLGATVMSFSADSWAAVSKPILHNFGGVSQSDGGNPTGALIQASDGNYYGTTVNGGNGSDFGTVFMVTSTGQLTTLYSFSGGADGSYPDAGLIQGNDGNFYGITSGDAAGKAGTVFRITPSGVLTTLYSFSGGNDGGHPEGRLVQASDGNFYGTTADGGTFNAGTVFKMTPDGTLLTTLYSFTGGNNGSADGGYPQAGVIEASDGYLYGTTLSGGTTPSSGTANCGTVFHIGTDGMGYATLYTFTCTTDQGMPIGGLVEGSDEALYGTTSGIGIGTDGTAFKISTDGLSFSTLYSLDGINGDGSVPRGTLILGTDGAFYGTTSIGEDALNNGTVFSVTAAKQFTALYSFSANVTDGTNSDAGLVQGSDGNLYGTTASGGNLGDGTAFRVVPATQLVPPISVTLNPASIVAGQSTRLSWHVDNATGGSSSLCFASGDWSQNQPTTGAQTLTLNQAGTYNYALTCGGVESSSATLRVTTLSSPSGLTAQASDGQVSLTWMPASVVTSYQINYGPAGSSPTTIFVSNTSTSTVIAGLTNGTQYFFKIATVNGGATSALSAAVSATPIPPLPLAPDGLTASVGNAQIVLTWNAPSNATSYNIYVGTSPGGENLSQPIAASASPYRISSLTNGTTYYFKVGAVNNLSGAGPLSAETSATPVAPPVAAPTSVTASPGDTEVLVNWTAVAGATSYTLSYRPAGGSTQSIPAITGTSYLVTGLTNDTAYSFVVAGVNVGGAGPQSAAVSANPTALPAAPDGVTALPKNAKVVLSWNPVVSANQYNVFVGTSPGGEDLSLPITTSATSYAVGSLANGTTYYFTVQAVNRNGPGPTMSLEVSTAPVAPPAVAPDGLTAAPGDSQVALNWNAVAGADSYAIYQGTSSDDAMIVATVTGTSTTITGLANGTTYYFKVGASNLGGSGPISAAVRAVPAVPPQSSSGGGAFGPGILGLLVASAALRRRRSSLGL